MDAGRPATVNLQRDLDIADLKATLMLLDLQKEVALLEKIVAAFQPVSSAIQRDAKEVAKTQLLLVLLDGLLRGDFLPRSDEALKKMNQALGHDLSWIIGSSLVPEVWFVRVEMIRDNNQQASLEIQRDARQRRWRNGSVSS